MIDLFQYGIHSSVQPRAESRYREMARALSSSSTVAMDDAERIAQSVSLWENIFH